MEGNCDGTGGEVKRVTGAAGDCGWVLAWLVVVVVVVV